jgi:uncharacterized protein with HEPN domain
MLRRYKLYLEDILASADSVQSYVGSLSYEELIEDKMRVDAVIRNLEIIGEAAGKVPQDVRERYPAIEWRKISDFRNILVHEYFQIDTEILWDIVKNRIPDLTRQIDSIITKEE